MDEGNQKSKFCSEENLIYIQVGNGYLGFEKRIRKTDINNFIVANGKTNEVIRLVNFAFAYTIHDARISSSTGVEREQNKPLGPVSTIMRL